MNTTKSLKKLWLVLVITVFLTSIFPTTVFADDAEPPKTQPNKNVPNDPNRPLTPEEKKFRAAKYRALKQFLEQSGPSISASPAPFQLLNVGTWRQPNTAAYVNHCGPGATQVALDARWPASRVYGIDRIAIDEKTNANGPGTWMNNIVATLNSDAYLGGEFPNPNGMLGYESNRANGQTDLSNKIRFDIGHGYAMIAGVMTTNMPGWNGYSAAHIVAVIGYKVYPTYTDIYYTDTSTPMAGYTGPYRQIVRLSNFYQYVFGNNTLAW